MELAQKAATHPYPGGIDADIWVCAGQSNMAGAGLITKKQKPNPSIMVLGMDDVWAPAVQPTHRILEAVAPAFRNTIFAMNPALTQAEYDQWVESTKGQPMGGIGPDLFFAEHVFKHTGRPIGLIPCALGATAMAHWDPATKDQGNASLYGNMMERIAMVGGKVKGILWYQGESETGPDCQDGFDDTFLNLVDSIRRDAGIPDLPFIYVQIGRYCVENHDTEVGWETIRDKQRRVASQRANLFVVPVMDLPLDDLIHIGTAGHKRLGKRLAEVALDKVYALPGHATTIDYDSYEILPAMDPLHNMMRVRFTGVNGKLQAAGRPAGFEFKPEDPDRAGPVVFKVDFDPKDPAAVIVWYSTAITKPVSLYYGLGMNPYVNIVDSMDMAIPAFGPITIEPMP